VLPLFERFVIQILHIMFSVGSSYWNLIDEEIDILSSNNSPGLVHNMK
jgi:hypothetical protein